MSETPKHPEEKPHGHEGKVEGKKKGALNRAYEWLTSKPILNIILPTRRKLFAALIGTVMLPGVGTVGAYMADKQVTSFVSKVSDVGKKAEPEHGHH